MEACYEKNGTIDAKAREYWTVLRNRARMDADFDKTIAATDMNREKRNDWGAYSAGQVIDATLYNIRRERRCELMAEGLRYMDLKRWRAMDQMINEPYHIEGFKLWGPMKDWCNTGADGSSILIYGLDNDKSNVSAPERSMYLRPDDGINSPFPGKDEKSSRVFFSNSREVETNSCEDSGAFHDPEVLPHGRRRFPVD
jgi:hypothetical protein